MSQELEMDGAQVFIYLLNKLEEFNIGDTGAREAPVWRRFFAATVTVVLLGGSGEDGSVEAGCLLFLWKCGRVGRQALPLDRDRIYLYDMVTQIHKDASFVLG